MKPIFVVKAGTTFPDLVEKHGDFEDWIVKGLGRPENEIQVVNALSQTNLPGPDQLKGAVISGSHDHVTQNKRWSLRLEAWARRLVQHQVPLLGICYGHQIIARAMGGVVDFHPVSLEIGTRTMELLAGCDTDPLFQGLPSQFKAHVFHSQSVIELPFDALVLAKNEFEPHQAFRVGKNAWGVQFHPEADAAVTRGYVRNLEKDVEASGQDSQRLVEQVEETPYAAALLQRFGDLVCRTGCRFGGRSGFIR